MCITCRYDYCKMCYFSLPAGKMIGTAQLAGEKKNTFFKKFKFSNLIISMISIQYRPLTRQKKNIF